MIDPPESLSGCACSSWSGSVCTGCGSPAGPTRVRTHASRSRTTPIEPGDDTDGDESRGRSRSSTRPRVRIPTNGPSPSPTSRAARSAVPDVCGQADPSGHREDRVRAGVALECDRAGEPECGPDPSARGDGTAYPRRSRQCPGPRGRVGRRGRRPRRAGPRRPRTTRWWSIEYIVQPNDSLSKIAQDFYGSARYTRTDPLRGEPRRARDPRTRSGSGRRSCRRSIPRARKTGMGEHPDVPGERAYHRPMSHDSACYIITGGAGFIGSSLVATLQRDEPDARIHVVDDFSTGSHANIVEQCERLGAGRSEGHVMADPLASSTGNPRSGGSSRGRCSTSRRSRTRS